MKKIFSLILSLCIIASLSLMPVPAFAETEDIYTYQLTNGEATITGCDKNASGDIIIPSSLGGATVTAIGENAFSGCRGITSVTIPESVAKIGGAFYDCRILTSIEVDENNTKYCSVNGVLFSEDKKTLVRYPEAKGESFYEIPLGVIIIGEGAFDGCHTLTNVVLSDKVRVISAGAFMWCTDLAEIKLPHEVYSIAVGAFSGCSNLADVYYTGSESKWKDIYIYENNQPLLNAQLHLNPEYAYSYTIEDGKAVIDKCKTSEKGDIVIPNTLGGYPVTKIAGGAFKSCQTITSVKIPDGVTTIGDNAFRDCFDLTSVTIPDSVTAISNDVFRNCLKLTSVKLPDGITTIGDSAFESCRELTDVTIPDSVTTIGKNTFSYCEKLKNIKIPEGVTSIGAAAFSNCPALENVKIPDGVTVISDRMFYNCQKLTSFKIPDSITTIGDSAFYRCSLTDIKIPEGVTAIGSSAFEWCGSLTTVNIPCSVTYIGSSAFYFTNLKDVYYAGDRVEWNEILLGDDNEYLLDADIHCLPSINVFSAVKSGNKIKVNVEIFDIEESDSIFVATYGENNKFLGFKKITLTDGEGTESLPYGGVLKLKGFLWNSKLSNIADCQQVFYK